MRWFLKFLDFYINSSIHVALAVTALTWVTFLENNYQPHLEILGFNFFATVTAYNFVKYFGLAKFHHRSLAQWLKIIQIFSAFCFMGLIYFTLKLPHNIIIFYGVFGIITFLYAVPFLPKRYLFDAEKNLRSISGVKIYVIAAVWVAAAVIAPILDLGIKIDIAVILKACQIFIIVLVWMLPFEIRDLRYDSIKLSTIPQIIGIKATKILGILLIAVFLILECLKPQVNNMELTVVVIIGVLSAIFILGATKRQNKYYSGLWVESIPVLWLLLFHII